MKENRYDDDVFFDKYSRMSRSVQGLSGAGEWRELEKLLPDFRGKRVLDLGCGYGWHCIYAAEHGARLVEGTDISHKMLAVAAEKCRMEQVHFIQCAMEDLEYEPECFDVVFSSLAFHYVADFGSLVEKIGRWLTPGGKFVFSVEHPVFTAEGRQEGIYDKDGKTLYFPVDNYYYEGKRDAVFLGEHVVKYHRTLTTYVQTLLTRGFVLDALVEPQPPEDMMDLPGMKDEMRRPMMLLLAATKTSAGCGDCNP